MLLLEDQPDTTSAAQVAQVAQRIIDTLLEPVVFSGHEVQLSCSVGIAMSSPHVDGRQLRAHADAAMYAAKRAGGSTYAFLRRTCTRVCANRSSCRPTCAMR